jgi:Domain of unknown function (DUF397)
MKGGKVPQGIWQKSSFSGAGPDNNCVEVATIGDAKKLRESDEPDVVITTTPDMLAGLILGIKSGEFGQLT